MCNKGNDLTRYTCYTLARSRFIFSETKIPPRVQSQFKSSFRILPSSGKTKISTFQLYRLKTSRQLWLAQNVTAPEPLSTLCCSVFSRDHAFIPEFPQFHRHSPVSHYRKPSSENSSPAQFPVAPHLTSTLFLSTPLQCRPGTRLP